MAAIALASGCNTQTPAAPNECEDQTLRTFNILDSESQERLIRLKSQYDNLLPMEKRALIEMLGLPIDERVIAALFEAQDKVYLNKLYHSERYDEVRRRDVGFAMLRQGQPPTLHEPAVATDEAIAADALAVSDAEFRGLLTPAVFGEGEVPLRVEKLALYDRIGMLRGDEEDKKEEEAVEEEDVEKKEESSNKLSSKARSHRRSTATTIKPAIPGIYRSNGYQSLRLGYSFPVQLNLEPTAAGGEACMRVYNLSGIPITQDQLRQWFDALAPHRLSDDDDDDDDNDEEAEDEAENSTSFGSNEDKYYLDVKTFLDYIRSLDRDFGVTSTYMQLQKDCEALAKDGDKLGFDAFACLMMRFLRA